MAIKEIPLTRGFVTIVDEADYEWLSQWKWYCSNWGYAIRFIGRKSIPMHRLIMDTPIGMDTDHINANRLDNRRSNLRICTRAQNLANKIKGKGSSKYKGVRWHKLRKKWNARIKVNQQEFHLGLFLLEQEAAKAYNEAAKKHFGEFARLNIII